MVEVVPCPYAQSPLALSSLLAARFWWKRQVHLHPSQPQLRHRWYNRRRCWQRWWRRWSEQ